MQQIDVSDLPEPIVRAIEEMVAAMRRQLGKAPPEKVGAGKDLPLWEGDVLGSLSREDLYDHDF